LKKTDKKTDLSHRGRHDYSDEENDDDRDEMDDLPEDKVIRKANDAIRKNQ
jgi:hypothetical protein